MDNPISDQNEDSIRKLFDSSVQSSISRLPQELRKHLNEIELIIDDYPEPGLLNSRHGRTFPSTILGLYTGTSMPHRSIFNPMEWPGRIYLFRKNILKHCRTEKEMEEQIFLTLMHELGHALGLDEGDLKARGLG